MEKQAIEQIQKSANIPELIKQVIDAKTQVPLILTPQDFKLSSLESYMPSRSSYRANMYTDSINDFIEYCKIFDIDGAQCFINALDMAANTVFDLGTKEEPLHQEHKAGLGLRKTSPYEGILNINGDALAQKTISEFIEDWADYITISDSSGNSMTTSIAAKRLRDLSIEAAREVNSKVSDFGESMSAMERIEAKGQDTLPSFLTFKCVPYTGLTERAFNLKLSILTGGEKPRVSVRIIQLEVEKEKITEEFKEIITKGFDKSKLTTFIGSIR